jgi:hypothetical protein
VAAPCREAEDDQQRDGDRNAAARLIERRDAADDGARGQRGGGGQGRRAAPGQGQRHRRDDDAVDDRAAGLIGPGERHRDAERGQRRGRRPVEPRTTRE